MTLSPLARRRLAVFKSNRRGYRCALVLLALFTLSLFAECIANDRPLLVSYKGQLLTPIFHTYREDKIFGGPLESEADYSDPWVANEIRQHGWMLRAPITYDYNSLAYNVATAPSPPSAAHWLGSDMQARDVLARVIYGFRLFMLFALVVVSISAVIGVAVGAVSGYFGGVLDLVLQRFVEIWEGLPMLYILIILFSFVVPSFWWLVAIMLLFQWLHLVNVVRAEVLRARNFDYVRAARALGLSELTILRRHVLPNAMVSVFTFVPFMITGVLGTLTALDFLGFGLPASSPSLGELLAEGAYSPQAPWLGIIGFFVLATMLSLWLFIGEAVRDAFNPRRFFTPREVV